MDDKAGAFTALQFLLLSVQGGFCINSGFARGIHLLEAVLALAMSFFDLD